jgi:hypothetical protein
MVKITRVSIENIMGLWGQIEPLVQIELDAIPTHDVDDVRRMLLANQAHLWVQWSDHVEAMAITDFVNYPRGLELRVWLGAVREGDTVDKEAFRTAAFQWARMNRCKWLGACGRIGWLKVFSDMHYTGVFMRATVDWSET